MSIHPSSGMDGISVMQLRLEVFNCAALESSSFLFQVIEGLLHFSYKVSKDDTCL